MVHAQDPERVVADAADFVFFYEAGQRTDQVAGLLLVEDQIGHIAEIDRLAVVIHRRAIDKGEMLLRMQLGCSPHGGRHVG